MTTAMWLLVYGAALTWLAPGPLGRLTRCGVAPRLGVGAWLTAIVAALLAWLCALGLLFSAAVRSLSDSTAVTLCLELFGLSNHTAVPGQVGAMALMGIGALASAVIAQRVSSSMIGLRARSHDHARAARIIGRRTERSDVVIIEARRPAAYCVMGRPHAIVVTSGALSSLNPLELAAVLAHEQAHISGRHHELLMLLRALAANLPKLPLFTQGAAGVADLLEMCADDVAVRRVGIRPLLAGLLTLADPHAPLPDAMAAGTTAVYARVLRLADPAHAVTRWRHRLILTATITVTACTPALIDLLCHH